MTIWIDATTLIALGTTGELDLLSNFDGRLAIPPAVVSEVTTEPAATNLDSFRRHHEDRFAQVDLNRAYVDQAMDVLTESERNGDVELVAAVLQATERGTDVAVVSDEKRIRTVSRGFDATVTGTIGVVVRAVEGGLSASEAKTLVRRIDGVGLHMTGALREQADELIDAAGVTE